MVNKNEYIYNKNIILERLTIPNTKMHRYNTFREYMTVIGLNNVRLQKPFPEDMNFLSNLVTHFAQVVLGKAKLK